MVLFVGGSFPRWRFAPRFQLHSHCICWTSRESGLRSSVSTQTWRRWRHSGTQRFPHNRASFGPASSEHRPGVGERQLLQRIDIELPVPANATRSDGLGELSRVQQNLIGRETRRGLTHVEIERIGMDTGAVDRDVEDPSLIPTISSRAIAHCRCPFFSLSVSAVVALSFPGDGLTPLRGAKNQLSNNSERPRSAQGVPQAMEGDPQPVHTSVVRASYHGVRLHVPSIWSS